MQSNNIVTSNFLELFWHDAVTYRLAVNETNYKLLQAAMADFNWQSQYTYQQFMGPTGAPFAAQPTTNPGYYSSNWFPGFSSHSAPVTQVNTLAKINSFMSLIVIVLQDQWTVFVMGGAGGSAGSTRNYKQ